MTGVIFIACTFTLITAMILLNDGKEAKPRKRRQKRSKK